MTDAWRSIEAAMAGPGRLTAAGSGPRKLRMGLRHETRPVRRFPSALEVLGRAGTGLPPEIFGSALLDVLGDRLREALAPPTATGPPDQPRPVAPWPDVTLEPAGTVNEVVPDSAEPAMAFSEAATPTGADRRLDNTDSAAPLPTRSRTRPVGADAGQAATARDGTAAVPILARRLAEYWRTLDRTVRLGPLSGLPPATAPQVGFASTWAGLGPAARAEPSWPGRGDAGVVGRPPVADDGRILGPDGLPWLGLDGAAGLERRWPDPTVSGPSSTGWQRTSERGLSGWRMTGHPGTAAGRPRDGEALQALSEEMAAVLREQATRHGIDIS